MNSYFNFFGNIILVQGPGQFQQHLPARQNQHVKRLLSRLVLLKHIANRNKVDTPWPSYSRQPITIFVSENAAAFHHKTVSNDSPWRRIPFLFFFRKKKKKNTPPPPFFPFFLIFCFLKKKPKKVSPPPGSRYLRSC